MAKKRMINADLLDNDVFLDLSISAKLLYFYLILKADDDGMIAKPKSVVREVQATLDDLEELKKTRYVLSFPSGVICIKHWKMHNSIPKDRYKSTTYQEELSTLIVRSDGSYTEKERHKELQSQVDTTLDDITGYSYVQIDMDSFWEKTVAIYPKKTSLTMAKTLWLDKFKGISPYGAETVAKTIFKAIKMYLNDYKKSHNNGTNEDYSYVPALDNWFKKEFDYWYKLAEKNQMDGDKK